MCMNNASVFPAEYGVLSGGDDLACLWRSYIDILERSMAAVIVVVNRTGRIVVFNNKAEKDFGLCAKDVIGKDFNKVFYHVPKHEQYILRALYCGFEMQEAELSYCPYAGKEGRFLYTVHKLVSGGKAYGAVWIKKEITAAGLYKDELQEAEIQAAVSQIAAATAHEIRNPLATARGFVQMAQSILEKKGGNQSEIILEYLAEAMAGIDNATHTISDFLALVHPRQDGLQIANINKIVHEVMHVIESVGAMSGVVIETSLDENIPVCLLDIDGIKKALLHVLHNAIQAMSGGGRLTVTTSEVNEYACISIADTGVGIPKEHLDRIYTPFFTTKAQGSGLGLTLANRIIQHHDGYIRVESVESQGTTVSIFLPARH